MKTIKILKYVSMTYGILVTLLMLLAIVPKLIGEFAEKGLGFLMEILKSFSNWDSPTAFFFIYIIGYAIIWWKPLWGSIIIIFASTLYVIIAGFDGPPIFTIPAFLVGLFYLIYLIVLRNNKDNE
ncbi:MAG: hypothetical protein H8E34_09820 [Bacteroidetes bacterium]|nr:hypothetical protein [Bacteroidota bacterium]MBL6942765.1 hypothetical protein [Bacteroidales bacterium]